jgi:hypothetical protein
VPATTGTATPSGTAQPRFAGFGASQLSCNDEGSIHSAPGGSEVSFSFINDTSGSLRIIRLDYFGNRETFDTLLPGYRYSVNTFTGNDWVVADSSANCLSIFAITDFGQVTVS